MTDLPHTPAPSKDDRVLTGILGIDAILGGGLPRDRLYLVEGTPGTGKTTLALQFLLEGRRIGELGMYVTLSETADELRSSAASHGWSLDGISVVELVPETGLESDQEQTLLHPAEFELGETTGRIFQRLEQEQPARLVVDSLSELRLLAQTALRYRRQILSLKHRLTSHRCTVLLLDDRTAEPRDHQLHSIAHGVITLEQSNSRYGAIRRSLSLMKMRGVDFHGGYHDFVIGKGGLAVYPRLVAPEHDGRSLPPPISTGVSELDALLGGGLVPGTSTLLMGPTGTGKTSTAIRCLLTALEQGRSAAVFMFDEELSTFFARAASLGMDLHPHLDTGLLQVRKIKPAELSPGAFVHYVRRAIEIDGARLIVIDSLNGYLHAMPNDQYLLLQMHELLSFLNQQGVVTLLVLAQHGLLGDVRLDVDLSYLSDTIVLMRFFEAAGEVRRILSVIKTRTTPHEPTIREYGLGPDGLTIGPVLRDFQGVLGGMPVYRGTDSGLMETGHSSPPQPPRSG